MLPLLYVLMFPRSSDDELYFWNRFSVAALLMIMLYVDVYSMCSTMSD